MRQSHIYLLIGVVLSVAVMGYYFGKNAAIRAFSSDVPAMAVMVDGESVPVQAEEESVMPAAIDLPADAGSVAAPLDLSVEEDLNQNNAQGELLGAASDSLVTPVIPSAIPAAPETALVGTHWALLSLNGQTSAITNAHTGPYIMLETLEKRVSGNAGCNRFSGNYSHTDDGNLTFGENIAMTRMACDAMDTETTFTQVLTATRGWKIDGGILSLLDEHGAELATFAAGGMN